MDIEDAQKNADSLPGTIGSLNPGDLRNLPIAGRNNQPWAIGNRTLRIAKKPEEK